MVKSVQAVERACDLMFLIASSETGLGVSELACELELSKSAVHRILVALDNKSMVRQDPLNQRYYLRPKVLQLALPFQGHGDIVVSSRPYLDALRDRFQETAVLVLRDALSFMTVAHSPSPFEYRFSPTTGRRMPLHWGAFGKAILAYLPDDDLADLLRNVPLDSATSQTVVDTGLLQQELCQIRERGFACSMGEVIEGHIGLARPLLIPAQTPTIFQSRMKPNQC